MNALRPFFMLIGRPSVFWLGAVGVFTVSMLVLGIVEPDSRLAPFLDPVLVSAIAFPALAGWLAGAVIQEFQHTTFAAMLPRVRTRVAVGFALSGVGIASLTVATIALNAGDSQHPAVLLALALAAFAVGGIFKDPLSPWVTSANVVGLALILTRSRDVARLVQAYPWLTVAVSLAVAVACVRRMFARATFRRKPFRPTPPMPGSFSLDRSQEFERMRRVQQRTRGHRWHARYLGARTWHWVRAAFHETHGARGWKEIARSLGKLWGIALLVVLYAWLDRGQMGLGEALGRAIHDALLRSPHVPAFAEHGGPYPLLALVLAASGVTTALFSSVALWDGLGHPLSRRARAAVHFRGGLVDAALYLLVLGPILFVVGHGIGAWLGLDPRMGFVPYFFRVLMVTVTLMPIASLGRIRLQAANRRRSANTSVAVVFGIVFFVAVVYAVSFLSRQLFPAPLVELGVLVGALASSQLAYRRALIRYYLTEDLA